MNEIKKIMVVFGTRPEAIKMAPLIHKLRCLENIFDLKVCVTGQHREMLDQVLNIFDIKPDIDLNIMQKNQGLFDITTNTLVGMKKALENEKPNILLVHGDTTTAFATALSGFYAGIPVGHVEAGLRTNNLNAPFPEEFNRQIISRISKWHFAPTELSRKNLLSEKVEKNKITVTGNTVIDSLRWILSSLEQNTKKSFQQDMLINKLLKFDWKINKYVLVTGHRRESFGSGIIQVCEAIKELATIFKNIHFVYPLHFNPNIHLPAQKILQNLSNVHIIEPTDYVTFVCLLKHCNIVLTDSGGIQEEAPSLGKPVLVTRKVTERPEAVKAGTVELVGTDKHKICAAVTRLFKDKKHYEKMSKSHNPYGDGKACDRIIKILKHYN